MRRLSARKPTELVRYQTLLKALHHLQAISNRRMLSTPNNAVKIRVSVLVWHHQRPSIPASSRQTLCDSPRSSYCLLPASSLGQQPATHPLHRSLICAEHQVIAVPVEDLERLSSH